MTEKIYKSPQSNNEAVGHPRRIETIKRLPSARLLDYLREASIQSQTHASWLERLKSKMIADEIVRVLKARMGK